MCSFDEDVPEPYTDPPEPRDLEPDCEDFDIEAAANEAKDVMEEIVKVGAKACLAQTKEPSRRWLIECAETHLGELIYFAELNEDDTVVEAARDAR